MKILQYSVASVLLWAISLQASLAHDSLKVDYNHAGLTGVVISDKALVLLTHRHRPAKGGRPINTAQDMSGLDRYEQRVTLSKLQKQWLRTWMAKNRLFVQATKNPAADRTYAGAFVSTLSIQDGRRSRKMTWNDASRAKALQEAAGELVEWARNRCQEGSIKADIGIHR